MRFVSIALIVGAVAAATPLVDREAPPEGEGGKVGLYEIHALQKAWLCFAPKVPEPVHGSLVGIIYCKDGHQGDKNLSQWQLVPTATGGQAKLSGTELCLDSGDTSNGIDMAVTTCSDSISQKFTFNQKTQIQANNQTMCIDARKDQPPTLDEWAPVIQDLQIWECRTGADNQVFPLVQVPEA